MPNADLVIRRADVRTMDPSQPWAQAVAIRGGLVAAVGGDRDVDEWIGSHTTVIDAAGDTVLPGFHDAHIHPVMGMLDAARCDISSGRDLAEYLRLVAEYAQRVPEGPIRGGGWTVEKLTGRVDLRLLLDGVTDGRPAYLVDDSQHTAWVNSAALRMAGIDRHTPDPPFGRIVRGADGEPTGQLNESAKALVRDRLPSPSTAELVNALSAVQARLFAAGITRWHDAIVTFGGAMPLVDAYLRAEDEGSLKTTVSLALRWDLERGLEQIDELLEARAAVPTDGMVRLHTIKVLQDGVLETGTASLSRPYERVVGSGPGCGISMVEPPLLNEAVTRLDAHGFQVHVHAVGDRAATEALDAFEAARSRNGARDSRHQIAHLQLVRPVDIPRFARLGVVANVQPLWATREPGGEDLAVELVGMERAAWQYPFRSLQQTGAAMAIGSDWPVSTFEPLQIVHVGVNRVGPGLTVQPLDGAERLGLDDILSHYTVGSAFADFAEEETGSITPGKTADLVVLDRNIHALAASDLATAAARTTIVRGEVVHEADV